MVHGWHANSCVSKLTFFYTNNQPMLMNTVIHRNTTVHYVGEFCPNLIDWHTVDIKECWMKDAQFHRMDGPAIKYYVGGEKWCQDGQIHREAGPAVIFPDESEFWYQHDQLHRDDGRDSAQLVTPFVQVGTYPTRNFATLGPL